MAKAQCCKLLPKEPKSATHLIFDLDGTLIDTQKHYLAALKSTCALYGKEFDLKLTPQVIGCPTIKVVQITVEAMKIPVEMKEFEKKYREIAYQTVVDAELLPGAEKLLRHFHRHHIPMAIATSSVEEGFQKKMVRHQDILSLFHHYVVSSDADVKRGKPFPDIFLVACSRFLGKPSPGDCLVFEDSLTGVTAAKSAGMRVVMVPDKAIGKDLCKDADLVIDSLEDFKPEQFGLPSFTV